ncbi:hypothetical protein Hanom_Chr07g00580241 [Helianthus anomalus]
MNTTGIVSGIFMAVTHTPRPELLLPFSHSQPLSFQHTLSISCPILQLIGAGYRQIPALRRRFLTRSGEERTGRRDRTREEKGGRRQTVGCRQGSDFLLMFFGFNLVSLFLSSIFGCWWW